MKKKMDMEKRKMIALVLGVLALATIIGLAQKPKKVSVSLNTSDASGAKAPKLADRAKAAQLVVVASALSAEASLVTNNFGDKQIYTDVNLKVEEVLKGSYDNEDGLPIVLSMIGGTLPSGLSMAAHALGIEDPAKPMKAGDRAVLFLRSVNGKYELSKGEHGLIGLDRANKATDGSNQTLSQLKAAIGGAQ